MLGATHASVLTSHRTQHTQHTAGLASNSCHTLLRTVHCWRAHLIGLFRVRAKFDNSAVASQLYIILGPTRCSEAAKYIVFPGLSVGIYCIQDGSQRPFGGCTAIFSPSPSLSLCLLLNSVEIPFVFETLVPRCCIAPSYPSARPLFGLLSSTTLCAWNTSVRSRETCT